MHETLLDFQHYFEPLSCTSFSGLSSFQKHSQDVFIDQNEMVEFQSVLKNLTFDRFLTFFRKVLIFALFMNFRLISYSICGHFEAYRIHRFFYFRMKIHVSKKSRVSVQKALPVKVDYQAFLMFQFHINSELVKFGVDPISLIFFRKRPRL